MSKGTPQGENAAAAPETTTAAENSPQNAANEASAAAAASHDHDMIDLAAMGTVSMNNVAGYVKTARKRKHHVAPAEGGHGTKRHRHLVTAADQHRLEDRQDEAVGDDLQGKSEEEEKVDVKPQFKLTTVAVSVEDDDEEWDQMIVEPVTVIDDDGDCGESNGNTLVGVKTTAGGEEDGNVAKTEPAVVGGKTEPKHGGTSTGVKQEQRIGNVAGVNNSAASGGTTTTAADGTRIFPEDPAEARAQKIAENRSIRAMDFCKKLSSVLGVVHRLRVFYRAGVHPSLSAALLSFGGDGTAVEQSNKEEGNQGKLADLPGGPLQEFSAKDEIRSLVEILKGELLVSKGESNKKLKPTPNQRPAWVSASKDGLGGTVMSKLAKAIVDWITSNFVLREDLGSIWHLPSSAASGDKQSSSSSSSAQSDTTTGSYGRLPLRAGTYEVNGKCSKLLSDLLQQDIPSTATPDDKKDRRIPLSASLFFSHIFISVFTHLVGYEGLAMFTPRTVMAFDLDLLPQEEKEAEEQRKKEGLMSFYGEAMLPFEVAEQEEREKMVKEETEDQAGKEQHAPKTKTTSTTGGGDDEEGGDAGEVQIVTEDAFKRGKRGRDQKKEEEKKKKKAADATGFAWCELWCPESLKFFSVNPCKGKSTMWNSPYTFASAGDHVADVTCRYINKWSEISSARLEYYRGVSKGYLWKYNMGDGPEVKPLAVLAKLAPDHTALRQKVFATTTTTTTTTGEAVAALVVENGVVVKAEPGEMEEATHPPAAPKRSSTTKTRRAGRKIKKESDVIPASSTTRTAAAPGEKNPQGKNKKKKRKTAARNKHADFKDGLDEESPLPHHITDASDCIQRIMYDFNKQSLQLTHKNTNKTTTTTTTGGSTLVGVSPMPSSLSPLSLTSEAASPGIKHTVEVKLVREKRQLSALMYSDPVPTTFGALKKHPLYVSEGDLGKFEAIYPKDKTTLVGVLKSKNVYKRTAIVPLMSKEGWLRHGKQVSEEFAEDPAKKVKPPASRPLAPEAILFGEWQTIPFKPADATVTLVGANEKADDDAQEEEEEEATAKKSKSKKKSKDSKKKKGTKKKAKDGEEEEGDAAPPKEVLSVPTIQAMGRPCYLLLGHPHPGKNLALLKHQHVAKVARRVNCNFGFACVGYEKKAFRAEAKARWVPKLDGIVVLEEDKERVERAYSEWIQIQEEAENKKRRVRALRWWRLFIQRRLAMNRLEVRYLNNANL